MDRPRARNERRVSEMSGDFVRRNEFYGDPARLDAALHFAPYFGGELRWSFPANCAYLSGRAATAGIALTEVAIAPTDYAVTANGGPYVDHDGATEFLWVTDANSTWAEVGAYTFAVWHWVYVSAFPAAQIFITCKQDAGGGNRQWNLSWNNATGAFEFNVSPDGTALVTAISAYAEAAITPYFVGGGYVPSNVVRSYVGAATDTALTATDTVGAPPAAIFTGGVASFNIGAYDGTGGGANFWPGRIGVGGGWIGGAAAGLDAYMAWAFHKTRWLYMA